MLYYATLPTGLESLARDCLPKGARLLRTNSGAALIECEARPKAWPELYTNVHLVLCQAKCQDFGPILRVAEATASTAFYPYTHPYQSFRVRFSLNGKAVSVSNEDMVRAEAIVKRAGRFRPDRVKSELEFWYILRDGSAFYTLLLARSREAVEKGALRPEIAYGMALFSGIAQGESALVPFAENDILSRALRLHGGKIIPGDAHGVKNASVDRIVTCLPDASLSAGTFREFGRVLRRNGSVTLLTPAAKEAENAAKEAGFSVQKSLSIPANGKRLHLIRLGRPAQQNP